MAYGHKYRSRRYKRSSKLSKANIYINRSAKSQSKQIAALSRKVNTIAKLNKPEVRTMWKTFDHEFTNSTFSSNFYGISFSPFIGSFGGNDNTDGDVNYAGNFNRSLSFSLRLTSEYRSNVSNESTQDNTAGLRIVIFQERMAQPYGDTATDPTVQQIFNITNNITSDDKNLVAPLVTGITQQYKILYSKTYLYDTYHATRLIKINIPGKKLLNFTRSISTAGISPQSKGKIWVAFLTGGLHYDTDYTSRIKINGGMTIAFTDN